MKVQITLEVDLTGKGMDVLKKEKNKYLKSALNGYLCSVTDKKEIILLDAKIN